jgi:hypothetical protein
MADGAKEIGDVARSIETLAGALTAIAKAVKHHAELQRQTQASMLNELATMRAADKEEAQP